MVSRDRVINAIKRKPVDRVPIDFGGSITTSINAMGYRRLKEYLGCADPRPKISNIILFLPELDQEIREKWGIDVVALDRYEAAPGIYLKDQWFEHPMPNGQSALFPVGFKPNIRDDGSWELHQDGTKMSVLSPVTGSFVPSHFPLNNAPIEKLIEFELPKISDEELEYLHHRAKHLFENTDYAVFGFFMGSIFETAQFLCGFDDFFIRLAADKDFAQRLLEKLTQRVIEDLTLYLDAVGSYIQVIGFGDDFGVQGGPSISPVLFREMIKPLLKRIYSTSHSLSQASVFLHSCGSVYEFIEDFIEIGVDILNPLQTSAYMMEPERLKDNFGDRISFWGGGCEVKDVLTFGTPEDVRKDVRKRIEIFGRGSGYVFAPIHDIQPDAPPENIEAMFLEASKTL